MEMAEHGRHAVTVSARLALRQLSQRLGAAGQEAMRALPGLAAVVDQHVAEIRRTVTDRRGYLGTEALAAYADGVADAVTAKGWSAQETAAGWHRASWASIHLLAVCVLAESAT